MRGAGQLGGGWGEGGALFFRPGAPNMVGQSSATLISLHLVHGCFCVPRQELSRCCWPADPWAPVGVAEWEGAVLAWQHLAFRRNGQMKAHVRGAALYSEVRALSCMSCSLVPETGLGRHLAHLCPCTCGVPRPALGNLTPAGGQVLAACLLAV